MSTRPVARTLPDTNWLRGRRTRERPSLRPGRAGGDVQARLPATGGPVDYADGGIGCCEPGDSFAGAGAARRCPGRCPRRLGI